jgi:hypothetical protein
MSLVQTNLSDHDVFWAERDLQIVYENSFDDVHAYSYQSFFHLDRVRVD